MKSVAILMTVHNRREQTLSCLRDVYAQIATFSGSDSAAAGEEEGGLDRLSWHVFLTDDGSTDGTREAVEREFPEVTIIRGDGNLYWNRGMYTAWFTARRDPHDYILWLNNDVRLYPDAFRSLLNTSMAQDDKAIIVGALEEAPESGQISFGGRDRSGLVGGSGTLREVRLMNGNLVLLPRFAYCHVGLLDPHYHHAFGDYDYALRAGSRGIKILASAEFLGWCHADRRVQPCFDPRQSLLSRWRYLYSPLSYFHPRQAFYFDRRHNNLLIALTRWVLIHLQTLFPRLKCVGE